MPLQQSVSNLHPRLGAEQLPPVGGVVPPAGGAGTGGVGEGFGIGVGVGAGLTVGTGLTVGDLLGLAVGLDVGSHVPKVWVADAPKAPPSAIMTPSIIILYEPEPHWQQMPSPTFKNRHNAGLLVCC